jgi:hypothetical protein
MSIRTIPVALALLLAFAAPAEAERWVLVRGEPELHPGPVWGQDHEIAELGFYRRRFELEPGLLTYRSEGRFMTGIGRMRAQEIDVEAAVVFDLPPERIELDEDGRATFTLTASGRYAGRVNECCRNDALQFRYEPEGHGPAWGAMEHEETRRPLLWAERFPSAGIQTNFAGEREEFWEGEVDAELVAVVEVDLGPPQPNWTPLPDVWRVLARLGAGGYGVTFPYALVQEASAQAAVTGPAIDPDAGLPAQAEPASPIPPAADAPPTVGLLEPPACPVTGDLLEGPIWRGFLEWVREAYDHPRGDDPVHPAVLGRALGRIALAVGGDEQRHVAFACLEDALDLWAAQVDQLLGMAPGLAFRTLWQAAMGLHDDEVLRITGIGDTSPAEDLMARLTASGRAAVVHPWEGLCVAEIMLVAGASPMFELRSGGGHVVVFADPVGTGLIGVDGCARRAWDHRAFEAEHAYVESRILEPDESRTYRRVDVYRARDGSQARISHFRH